MSRPGGLEGFKELVFAVGFKSSLPHWSSRHAGTARTVPEKGLGSIARSRSYSWSGFRECSRFRVGMTFAAHCRYCPLKVTFVPLGSQCAVAEGLNVSINGDSSTRPTSFGNKIRKTAA